MDSIIKLIYLTFLNKSLLIQRFLDLFPFLHALLCIPIESDFSLLFEFLYVGAEGDRIDFLGQFLDFQACKQNKGRRSPHTEERVQQ